MQLTSAVLEVDGLGREDRATMFDLMQRNYENVCRPQFESDLDAKRWVIVVYSSLGEIVGFSTQILLEARVDKMAVLALYSGDTVVDREHWGDPALAHAWGNFALGLIDGHPEELLYWFLTSKGFRTYHYLPLFFRSFFPRFDRPTPNWERHIVDVLGANIGGAFYDSSRSIIRASERKDFVRVGLGEPGLRMKSDPHVRFFVERNPGFERGDELCCLARLSRENFSRVAYRVIQRQSRVSQPA